MPPEQVILFIVGTIVILFGAYYVTYYVGMKATGQTRAGMRNRSIKMLDRYAISRDKQFCIVEIADKVYIVGVTNHAMTLLDTFDAATFAEQTENKEENATPWSMTPVGQYGNKLTKKVVEFIALKTGKKQQYERKTGTGDFAENMKEAEKNIPELQADKKPPENQPESTEEN
jgi:flagellar biogenesis protein FliO